MPAGCYPRGRPARGSEGSGGPRSEGDARFCALVARAVFTSGRPCCAAAIWFASRLTVSTLARRSSAVVLPRLGSSRRCWASTPALLPLERIGRGSQGQRDARTNHPRYLDASLRPAPTTQDTNCRAARPHGHVIDEQFDPTPAVVAMSSSGGCLLSCRAGRRPGVPAAGPARQAAHPHRPRPTLPAGVRRPGPHPGSAAPTLGARPARSPRGGPPW